jgi:hypothetical protein
MEKPQKHRSGATKKLKQLAPWCAGASLAVTHIAMSTNCTVTREGHCNSCGSCAVALIALVSWAVIKKGDKQQFAADCHCNKRL